MTVERPVKSGALSRLRAQLELLTPAQRRFAQHALDRPDEVLYQTVTEAADASGCGEATVIRLCRDLGFQGFQDFKLALAADLADRPAERTDSNLTGDLIGDAAEMMRQAIGETLKVLEPDTVERTATLIAAAPLVLASGQGASGITALDLAYKLVRLGVSAIGELDPHLAAMRASTIPTGAVVIGVSRSGSTVDTVGCLRVAREAGAATVAITHRARSPITQHADLVLYTASPESPLTGGATTSKVGQLLVLESLYRILEKRRPGGTDAVRRTAAAVTDRSY